MVGYASIGRNPRGCDSPEYLVSHEYGHCLFHRLEAARYEQWRRMENMGEICPGAREEASEAVAEGFAMIRHTPRTQWPRAVQRLHDRLEEDGVL